MNYFLYIQASINFILYIIYFISLSSMKFYLYLFLFMDLNTHDLFLIYRGKKNFTKKLKIYFR
jgi:hypothetical protein